ncbi:MAG TPA: serine hydrolase domain-containing protein [Anaerolineae bacterium]|nr:serine hydrolase domain-containing protein [Anaerolineae bacterium]
MLKKYIKLSTCFVFCLLFVGNTSLQTQAHFLESDKYYQNSTAQVSIDPVELETFVNDFFATKMEEFGIPGLAFIMVKDNQVFLSKGYGFADIDNGIAIDPTETVFRVGSVSKLFAATAIMQLAEQDLLDLHGDINQYLTVTEIPDTYSEPITPYHLLTHTAGFEDRIIRVLTFEPADVLSLDDFLANYTVERVNPPGKVHSYSNYGISLAGQIVAEISGKNFPQYMTENIFNPLEMNSTTFMQPLPADLESRLAVGYFKNGTAFEAGPFYHLHMAPAGSLTSTAPDMANFMLAMLGNGRYKNNQILTEPTIQEMQMQQFTHHHDLPGMTYGFQEQFVNNQRLIGHNGDIGTYSSQMILLPEHNMGFFMVYNVFSDALRQQFINAFVEHYFPLSNEEVSPAFVTLSEAELSRFKGSYRWVKYSSSTLGKLAVFPPNAYNNWDISVNDDGTLSLTPFGLDLEWRYKPVGPLLFKKVSGEATVLGGVFLDPGETLAFREDETGEIVLGFVALQNFAFEKLAWYESSRIQMGLLIATMLTFLSVIIWPLSYFINIARSKPIPNVSVGSQRARWLAGVICLTNLIGTTIITLNANDTLGITPSPFLMGALGIVLLMSLLTIGLVGMTFWAWKERYWTIWSRIHYTIITLATFAFIWWLNYWNLWGWQI